MAHTLHADRLRRMAAFGLTMIAMAACEPPELGREGTAYLATVDSLVAQLTEHEALTRAFVLLARPEPLEEISETLELAFRREGDSIEIAQAAGRLRTPLLAWAVPPQHKSRALLNPGVEPVASAVEERFLSPDVGGQPFQHGGPLALSEAPRGLFVDSPDSWASARTLLLVDAVPGESVDYVFATGTDRSESFRSLRVSGDFSVQYYDFVVWAFDLEDCLLVAAAHIRSEILERYVGARGVEYVEVPMVPLMAWADSLGTIGSGVPRQ